MQCPRTHVLHLVSTSFFLIHVQQFPRISSLCLQCLRDFLILHIYIHICIYVLVFKIFFLYLPVSIQEQLHLSTVQYVLVSKNSLLSLREGVKELLTFSTCQWQRTPSFIHVLAATNLSSFLHLRVNFSELFPFSYFYLRVSGNEPLSFIYVLVATNSFLYLCVSGNELLPLSMCQWQPTSFFYLCVSGNELLPLSTCQWQSTSFFYVCVSGNELLPLSMCQCPLSKNCLLYLLISVQVLVYTNSLLLQIYCTCLLLVMSKKYFLYLRANVHEPLSSSQFTAVFLCNVREFLSYYKVSVSICQ